MMEEEEGLEIVNQENVLVIMDRQPNDINKQQHVNNNKQQLN